MGRVVEGNLLLQGDDGTRPMSTEVERIKLTASFLNNMAAGVALAGFIKPLVDAADASLTLYARLPAAAAPTSPREMVSRRP